MTNQKLFEFIKNCPTPYHAVAHCADILDGAGYTPLSEAEEWSLEAGRSYYVTRGGSSIIAFRVPKEGFKGFMMSAAHSDSPTFRIKDNPELKTGNYVKLSVERYGGMLCSTWFDRPLGIAGRVCVRTESGMAVKLVDLGESSAMIPNVAIHMNRKANDGVAYNPAVDMLPIYCTADKAGSFKENVASAAGVNVEDILSYDLMLYASDKGTSFGGFIAAPRLDDLQCAFATLEGFLTANEGTSMPIWCMFDNEEVGSLTKQGADSTFMYDVLSRICSALSLGDDAMKRLVAGSFLVSCDNAHAMHPNHPELSDPNHTVQVNGGIVIKYNANQKYTSDALSTAIFRLVCESAGVPCQIYANRADMPGGSTLGNISNSHVSLNTVDIGIAQLAMHSAYESCGESDTDYMIRALREFFGRSLEIKTPYEFKMI